jgi:hypothetical protein
MLFISALRHLRRWPNSLKNFSNFETGYEGPKRELFAHGNIKVVDLATAPPYAVARGCAEANPL